MTEKPSVSSLVEEPGQLVQSKRRVDVHAEDKRFFLALRVACVLVLALFAGITLQMFHLSWPALSHFGLGFLAHSQWNPVSNEFGSLSFVYGTIVSSLIALVISVPVSIGVALFLTEVAPRKPAQALAFLVEMLAAIPSVVYGLWGIFVFAPLLRQYVEPFLREHLGFVPLFQGAPFGVGMLCAGVILAIMITPTISAICREVFLAISLSQREAALALGATRWEMVRLAILKGARGGILGAVILGLGRALGETMAVTMVIGNRPQISASLFAPAQTMASVIANEYAEATGDLHLSALAAIGLVLFGVSFIINVIARRMVLRFEGNAGGRK
jgi:phosphate transport system permease protein